MAMGPVEQQRLLHVLLGVLALFALVGFLLLVDGVIVEIGEWLL